MGNDSSTVQMYKLCKQIYVEKLNGKHFVVHACNFIPDGQFSRYWPSILHFFSLVLFALCLVRSSNASRHKDEAWCEIHTDFNFFFYLLLQRHIQHVCTYLMHLSCGTCRCNTSECGPKTTSQVRARSRTVFFSLFSSDITQHYESFAHSTMIKETKENT